MTIVSPSGHRTSTTQTESGVAFPRCEGGPMLGHIPNMHLPGVGSSRLTDEYDKAPEREVSARGPRTATAANVGLTNPPVNKFPFPAYRFCSG